MLAADTHFLPLYIVNVKLMAKNPVLWFYINDIISERDEIKTLKINPVGNVHFNSGAINPASSKAVSTVSSDTVSLNPFNELLMADYYPSGVSRGSISTFFGTVNGKPVFLKYNPAKRPEDLRGLRWQGFIGQDSVDIQTSDIKMFGTIGNKDVDLNFYSVGKTVLGPDKKYKVNGKIGDKRIDLGYGSLIQSAKGENDILTLGFSLCCRQKFTVKNGRFDAAQDSEYKKALDLNSRFKYQAYTWPFEGYTTGAPEYNVNAWK